MRKSELIHYSDDLNTVTAWQNEIMEICEQTCARKNVDSLTELSENEFKAFLMTVGRKVFQGSDRLYRDRYVASFTAGVSNPMNYDISKLNDLLDIYIYICLDNDKAVTQAGFCLFAGISSTVLQGIINGKYEQDYINIKDFISKSVELNNNKYYRTDDNNKNYVGKYPDSQNLLALDTTNRENQKVNRSEFAKKFSTAYESSLESKLLSGKNPVGTLAILNRRFRWDEKLSENSENVTQKRSLTEIQAEYIGLE